MRKWFTDFPFSEKMEGDMNTIRLLKNSLEKQIQRGKSILLLGPRQTGKTTLLSDFTCDFNVSFIQPSLRQKYERHLDLLRQEIESLDQRTKKIPLVILDEVQKVPLVMDLAQDLIDRKRAQFILTGSSARKLHRAQDINLLPGRVVQLRLSPFTFQEYSKISLEQILCDGQLPAIALEKDKNNRQIDLETYVQTYLEEEVRAEALVKNVGQFLHFLEYAGLESGKIVSFRNLAQEIGISHVTVSSYFEILKDCLIAEEIFPITKSKKRKRLIHSSKYLIFDLGVRRQCAREGRKMTPERWGELFEQYVGLELLRYSRLQNPQARLFFWKDTNGPEVDWVLEKEGEYIPIEVKWTETPKMNDAKHLQTFLSEYSNSKKAYIVSRASKKYKLGKNIEVLPWQNLSEVFEEVL